MEKPDRLSSVESDLSERSRLCAKEKLERITEKDFHDFAIRTMNIDELEEIISTGKIPNYREAFMPNHEYGEVDRQHTDRDKAMSAPRYNEQVYGHYSEKKPRKSKSNLSFVEYLHHDQVIANREHDSLRKLVESTGNTYDETPPIVKEDWPSRVKRQTQEISEVVKTYDVALVLDISLINKANPKAGFSLPWGFVYTRDEDQAPKTNPILGIVSLRDDSELQSKLIKLSSQGDRSGCPIFGPEGQVLFP